MIINFNSRTHERTQSAWGYLKMHLWDYLNPYYKSNEIIPVLNEPLKISEFSYERHIDSIMFIISVLDFGDHFFVQ